MQTSIQSNQTTHTQNINWRLWPSCLISDALRTVGALQLAPNTMFIAVTNVPHSLLLDHLDLHRMCSIDFLQWMIDFGVKRQTAPFEMAYVVWCVNLNNNIVIRFHCSTADIVDEYSGTTFANLLLVNDGALCIESGWNAVFVVNLLHHGQSRRGIDSEWCGYICSLCACVWCVSSIAW